MGKICTKCKTYRLAIEFYPRHKSRDGLFYWCKLCLTSNAKARVEEIRLYKRKYYLLHRRAPKHDKDYVYNAKKRHKERMAIDINYKLACNLRVRLHQFIRQRFKKMSLTNNLCCSYSELRVYLESKFKEGMSWDNYGRQGWHIDHIKPLSSFDLTDEKQFKQAVHYTNLQPLWARDNLIKSAKSLDHTYAR